MTASMVTTYAYDKLTEDQEEEKEESVDVRAERDYMLGYKDECPWEGQGVEDTESLLEEEEYQNT